MYIPTSVFNECATRISNCARELERALQSSWDDPVKDSFVDFVAMYRSRVNYMSNTMSRAATVCGGLHDINGGGLVSEAQSLMKAVESIGGGE